MTPRSFDPLTSREALGDERARGIEAQARADADAGREAYAPPHEQAATYWGQCQTEFARSIYHEQFRRRLERNERKAASAVRGPK